uniref:Uncharacterized protein n=1 Tax=Lactuca sativa TaxID=4236 RepID=A0A9R1V6B1_LACSA|nr:hypothetical protein LSAT_V11C600337140 [Lactuca sativa]
MVLGQQFNPTQQSQSHLFQTTSKGVQVRLSNHKLFRAKSTSIKTCAGRLQKQYDILRDYVLALHSFNPDRSMKLQFDSEPN